MGNTSNSPFKRLKINFQTFSRIIVYSAISLTLIDFIYAKLAGINYNTKDKCIIYSFLPKWGFILYEFLFELVIIVLIGVFAAYLIEHFFSRIKRFYPKNQMLAFLYASIIPVCSCGVIPLIDSMKKRVSLKIIITFILAAPLLNPFIIALSFSVLGVKYALLRIISSFILAISAGIVVEFFAGLMKIKDIGIYDNCSTQCSVIRGDIYEKTLKQTWKLFPYILIAGALTLAFELLSPKRFLETLSFQNEFLSLLMMEAIGIPIYVCNGADILFLKPLLNFTDLSMGAAMIFSLTSSAICISSIIMLIKFLGRKLTLTLVAAVFIITLLIGMGINLLP